MGLKFEKRFVWQGRWGGALTAGIPNFLYTKSSNAATVLRYCALSVFTLFKHCRGNSALVRYFAFFFFFRPVATVVIVFFCLPFVLFFFPLYILFYYTTNFTIFLQLLRCQFLISQNKIIKYETVINHNWK